MELPAEFTMLTVIKVENPKWSSADHIQIDCDLTVKFPGSDVEETIPFTACPWDTFSDHCAPIFEYAAALPGIVEYERPAVTADDLQVEFDKIWPDVLLGLADQATIDLAKNLRIQIKAMQE
ncbi:tail fiber protein [Pseudomonas phage vB_PpuP-Luke-3]